MNSGSRWPSSGRAKAAATSGYGLRRPGAHQHPVGERHGGIVSRGVVPRRRVPASPAPAASALDQDACQPVEDVGLAHQALVEPEAAHDRDEDAHAADDDVGPLASRGPGCRAVRRSDSVASVRNTSSAAAFVSSKWWIRSRS